MKSLIKAFIAFAVALVLVVGVLALDAHAADPAQEHLESYLLHQSMCYAVAKTAGYPHKTKDHMTRLNQHIKDWRPAIMHAISFSQGYINAIAHVSNKHPKLIAQEQHKLSCVEVI